MTEHSKNSSASSVPVGYALVRIEPTQLVLDTIRMSKRIPYDDAKIWKELIEHAAPPANTSADGGKESTSDAVDALKEINELIFATCGQPLDPDRYFKIRELCAAAIAKERS